MSSVPSYYFTIRKDRIPRNGICPIYVRYTYHSRWKDIATGLKVHHKDWSSDSGSPIKTCESREQLIQKLNEKLNKVKKLIEDRIDNDESLLPKDVKPEIIATLQTPTPLRHKKPTVEQAFKQFIDNNKENWKPNTVQSYHTMFEKHLKPFCEETNRSLSWSLFDDEFDVNWRKYFINHNKQNTTSGKNFRRLHTFLSWSYKKKILSNDHFLEWTKVREKTNPPVVCSPSDLAKLKKYAKEKKNSNENRLVANMFLFLCYTGLRIGDFINLRYRNIYHDEGHHGPGGEKYWLKLLSGKTEVPITIPLLDTAWQIILNNNSDLSSTLGMYGYKSEDYKEDADFVWFVNPVINKYPNKRIFRNITQQMINEKIKKVGEECGINTSYERVEWYGSKLVKVQKPKYELLTCHTGRRTFITLALTSEIPVPVIMKYTGHTSYKSIAKYFAISSEILQTQMDRLDSTGTQRQLSEMEKSFKKTFY